MPSGMQQGIRQKLVLLSLVILVVVSFGFTVLQLHLTHGWVEEDLKERAITFAREIAATIGDRRELESTGLLAEQIDQILAVRQSVLQIDIIAFSAGGARVVATSHPVHRLPFTKRDGDQIRKGQVLSRLVNEPERRYWEVMAPVRLEGVVAGAVAARFSTDRADALASRIRWFALALTAGSVLVMGVLMGLAVHVIVTRPLRRVGDTVERVLHGDRHARVPVAGADEFAVLAHLFNEMMERIGRFSDELEARVAEATAERDQRYQELQRVYDQLFRAQRRLSHAERVALPARIVAQVAHEVGSPLHSIMGHVELLKKDLPRAALSGDVERRLAVIEAQLARVTEIIARLLDVTRRAPGQPVAVDLRALVGETAELVQPALAAGGIALDVICEGPATVRGHAGQLQQVVVNLLTNAIDAMPSGGRLTVRIAPSRAGDAIEVVVSDTGAGIPVAVQKEIFEPFFSTKHSTRSAGLGLFISEQIVREHGGRIEVQSEEGVGTSFRVSIPPAGAR